MIGGAGNDTYVVDNAGDIVTENGGEGTDTVQTTLTTYTLGGERREPHAIPARRRSTAPATASPTRDQATAANTLDGGAGADTLTGGAGNDTYVVDNAGDVVTETAGEGTDTVQTALTSYTLAANVENLTLTGAAAITGTGNALANMHHRQYAAPTRWTAAPAPTR